MRAEEVSATIQPDWWIVSDTHFGHDNIIRFCGRPADHEKTMAENWHEKVGENDTILHLGDLYYKRAMVHLIGGLPGKKLLLRGNHDTKPRETYQALGFDVIEGAELESYESPQGITKYKHGFFRKFGDQRVLFSHFPFAGLEWDLNIHGHTHNHGYPAWVDPVARRYINVSVEERGYAPVRLSELLQTEEDESDNTG